MAKFFSDRCHIPNSPKKLALIFLICIAFAVCTPETASAKPSSYMTLTPTGLTNKLGNPLYQLSLYGNGQLIEAYMTVTGRAYTQNYNRHQAGTEAPLPEGKYRVAREPVPGTIPEVGDRFLPIQPLFRTGRSALGIHYDPSFEKRNGEDGTSGCVALTNPILFG